MSHCLLALQLRLETVLEQCGDCTVSTVQSDFPFCYEQLWKTKPMETMELFMQKLHSKMRKQREKTCQIQL